MPEERSIPAVETVAQFKLKINDEEVSDSAPRIAISVVKTVNKIASATLVIQDGQADTGTFPLADGDLFTPGNTIEIGAGDSDTSQNIFTGIIIKQSLKVRNAVAPQLIVECRHKVIKATIGRKSAYFHEMTDSDILAEILERTGFSSSELELGDTSITHKEMVQYNTTDWDFIISRAEANGQVVLTNDEKVVTKQPTVEDSVDLSLLHGSTIIEMDVEMDSRNQYKSVKTKSWDTATQEVEESEAKSPEKLKEQGTLEAETLANVASPDEFILNHGAAISSEERQSWADSFLLKSRLSKIRGRVKFQGIAAINPGNVIELAGLGSRFSGKAFVSGVRQDYNLSEGWKTQAQFGHTPEWFIENTQVTAAKAGGLLPGVVGLHTGIVTDNEDPEGEQRVRVKMPYVNADDDGVWARIALADAGNERGLFFRPEVDDEVVLGFLYDDPRYPVILGMLHSSNKVPPISPTNDNFKKGYTSREKLKLTFDDDIKEILIETPGENKVFISDDKKGVSLEDQSGHKITTEPDSITIKDSKDNEIHIDVNGGTIKIKGNSKIVVDAPQIELVGGATHPLAFGDDLLTHLNNMKTAFDTHMHPGETAMGMPVSPAPPAAPMPPAIASLLSTKVKTG
jgi:Rhs element Vgr protein